MKTKLTKKEIKLYMMYGKKWDIVIKHYITVSSHDTENILKVHSKSIDSGLVVLKRVTKRIKVFNRYIYFNTVYGGVDDERIK